MRSLKQGRINFLKIYEPFQNSGRQKSDLTDDPQIKAPLHKI